MIYWVIGIAGMIGALLRYVVGILFPAGWFWGFPLGTLFVNWIGCFLLSWLMIWSVQVFPLPSWLRTGLGTGLVGSFTTFSTFSVEAVRMIYSGLWRMALLYVFLSLWGGLFFAWIGSRLSTGGKNIEPGEADLL
ncbi:fluoride efflux transporter CrcB [Thermoactinomyces mirandus]|uniref:Fluoride-specific ion channel FluC n=1 Tax=Thermoactinomyces mirandus TaxID=2756294 RepID=A0A7W2AR16_9BACL|nr:fluoride efflux transporter CrcB [Thermoactinomyces mirandus]MBA4601100.1 fluoride efflux transporter CrcB [Thermoactinomyces mirandus]